MKTQIVKFHETEIECPMIDGKTYVAIKPICSALGVSYSGQFERIKRDEILGELFVLARTTGADGKQYEMQCLPLEFVFGWLFSIDHKQVKEDAREAVLAYKKECYKILYDHFNGPISKRRNALREKLEAEQEIKKLDRAIEEKIKDLPEYKQREDFLSKKMVAEKQIKQVDTAEKTLQMALF